MRRRKDNRPTFIYWLTDTRRLLTPFYCGKTVLAPERRLLAHHYEAVRGTRPVHAMMRECGENVRIDLVDIVPPGGDWSACEKQWIALLRRLNPNCCNTNDGGAGCPGRIASEESREKMSAWQRGRKLTPEHRAKIANFMTGRKWPAERIERMRAKLKGRTIPPEARAKIAEANKGRPSALRGVPRSAAVKAKISTANKGRPRTAEWRANASASRRAFLARKKENFL